MQRSVRFTIMGSPRTKKNHGWRTKHGKHMPSKAWAKWAAWAELDGAPFGILWDVNCKALFYRDAKRGDAVGFYQGLADLLEKRGVVVNDKQLVSWDGSRLLKDKDNPRVEVELTEAA
jgi:hypothetical protein